jgi:CRP-like cAMP-binding protein/AmiR/NasT family two-component response regulator
MAKTIIILIEDTKDLRVNLKEILELTGYNVILAAFGKEGLDAINKHKADLVLCDIGLPGLDGYGVLSAVKNMPHMIGVPFIFMTAKSEPMDLRKGMNLGADDYLIKPFTDEDLLEVVNTQLKKSRQIKEKFESENKKIAKLINKTNNYKEIFDSSPYKVSRKVKARQMIYIEGDAVNFIFCLAKGKVKTFKSNGDGKDIITGLHNGGDIFGHVSFLEKSQKESCTAIEESELFFIPKEEFLQMIDSNINIALMLIKSLAGQFLETGDKMLKLAYDSSRKKIADALLFYDSKYKQLGQNSFPFDRRDIAAIAGVAKESVSRKLTDFHDEGLIKIDIKTGKIIIERPLKLENL